MTNSCMTSSLEEQIVLRVSRLIQVLRFKFFALNFLSVTLANFMLVSIQMA